MRTANVPRLTIGIEEEFQIVDAEGQLKSASETVIAAARPRLGEQIKPEMMQSVIEAGTKICADISEARAEISTLRGTLAALLQPVGLRIASAGTHPFSHWQEQQITEAERYKILEDELQDVIRELLIFGLHVHVGIEDREASIHLMNAARYFLPHILALSTNSPFWLGMDTGLKSYRCKVFDKFPRTNIPDYFQSWGEYETFINLLVHTGCIDNAKKIWWDIRPHPNFPTLEFRICDIPMRVDETLAIAALIQATVAKLYKLHSANQSFRLYRRALIMENKWRALRYGIDGKLIDFGKSIEVPLRDLIYEYLHFIDDVVDELGSRNEINYIHKMLEQGTGADRQLRVFRETGDLIKVVDYIISETGVGVPHPAESQTSTAKT